MTFARLAILGLVHYRRTYLAVALGVATAVAVLSGALLVGNSVRASLGALASGRLGRTEIVVAAETPFGDDVAARLAAPPAPVRVAPMIVLDGTAQSQTSGRRAGRIHVYGVDDRFFAFHGVVRSAPAASDVWLSPDLAAELGAEASGAVVIQVRRPTDIPLESLHGRKDDVGRSLRLVYRGTLGVDAMGEFSLAPTQGTVRAAFVALSKLQRDLNEPGRINTLLLAPTAGGALTAQLVQEMLKPAITLKDLGVRVTVLDRSATILVESSSGMLADAVVSAATSAAARESLRATTVLTWLATRMTVAGRTVPYSLVSAVGPDAAGDAALQPLLGPGQIALGEWAARDVGAKAGDTLDLEYLRWADEGRLVTEHASFRVSGIVPMEGLTADRRLAPEYPGITDTASLANWDPPFPIDLKLVRPADEDYWRRFRTTPKAFLSLSDGQRMWRTRQGQATSIRLTGLSIGAEAEAAARRVGAALEQAIDPVKAGFSVVDVGRQQQSASTGTTDFGAYFSYFSFFLVVSALLLTALFFRLSVEQRAAEIGVLRAAGFSLGAIRRLLVLEGAVVSAVGAGLGIVLAVGWADVMVYGLRTWWVDAVGTTLLRLHVDAMSVAAGAIGGAFAATASIAITVRGLNRLTPRSLLTGSSAEPSLRAAARGGRGAIAAACLASAVVLSGLAWARIIPAAGGFFGAGALVLAGGLKKTSEVFFPASGKKDLRGLWGLAIANASWRPGRSLTSAGLVAAAVFLLVSVDAFRKSTDAAGARDSGTGGFALVAESALPIIHNPSTPEGRRALGLDVDVVAARLRPGDDVSCLNLYQPRRPRIVGVPDAFVEAGRFRFAGSLASTDADRANPWRLLNAPSADDIVPAIVDGTSLEYALHASLGDVITVDADSARPIRLRIVGSLDDSMLQGEMLISDRAFRQLFPEISGYRILLVDLNNLNNANGAKVDEVARLVEDRLEPYGVDVESSVRRLAAFHRVENTYLSTFQALGGLGLVLGCFGLAAVTARNVLERRREFALLGAGGFTGADLQMLVVIEQMFVVSAGLIVGLAAAIVATAPLLATRGGVPPAGPMVWVALVAATGLVTAMAGTRQVRRLPLVASLRGS